MPAISSFATGDLLPIVDVSEISASDKNKSVTFGELFRNVLGGSASAPSIAFTGDQNTGIYSPGADQVAVATNGTGRLFVDASGNVGVGTSSVNALLEVNNSTAGGEVQRIEGNYSGSGSVILTNWRRAGGSVAAALKYNDDSSPLCMSIGTTTSHEFRIRTADTDAITIDTSQRVGIGTSSPVNVLELAGNNSAGNGIGNVQGILRVNNNTTAFGSSPTAGIVFATKYRSSPDIPLDGAAIYGGKENTSDANKSFFLAFATRAESGNNGNEAMRINSQGRVGIGTTSPGSLLSLKPASGGGLEIQDTGGTARAFATLTGSPDFSAKIKTSNYYLDLESAQASGGQGHIRFFTGVTTATQKAAIDSSGRLLVGTSSATATSTVKLQGNSFGSTSHAILYLSRGVNNPADGNDLGKIHFSDSSESLGAAIYAFRNAGTWTPGSSHPTALVFSTTADGASSPTARMELNNSGGIRLFPNSSQSINLSSAKAGGTSDLFFVGKYGATGFDSGTNGIIVYTNGNVVNANNSYGAISDIKLKENIVDANSQWDDLKALQVRNYNFKEGQTHTQIGLVAQEVELVSPGLVSESPTATKKATTLAPSPRASTTQCST
jgi:hypothetical protein